MNPNTALSTLPAQARRAIYAGVGILAVVVGCATAGFVAIGHASPVWLAFVAGALVPLTVASNAIALSNVTTKPREDGVGLPDDELQDDDVMPDETGPDPV